MILVAHGVVDRVDRHTEAQIAAARAEAVDGCWPAAGQTAIITSNGRSARCRILSTPSTSPGMAPRLISAAVVDLEVLP